jgi:hypothetical protein
MDLQERLVALLSRKFILSLIAIVLIAFVIDVPAEQKLETIKWVVIGTVTVQAGQNAVSSLKD